ncbi:CDP-glucose 4,6-dehydratase [bacterium]|nr:CDP-glucose 4,6-dehydratase [bacterium]
MLGITPGFWQNRRVWITGHTGFKGSWLSLWLQQLGAIVGGYALAPVSSDAIFCVDRVGEGMTSCIGDIRNLTHVLESLQDFSPEIVFHMAAQPLVRDAYHHPVDTYQVNLMGTVHVLEAVRQVASVNTVIVVTTDKCYQNHEWPWGYRETDALGGHDPYSNSKACAELVVSAYRSSFFNPQGRVRIASVRAGNVIGGGDVSVDRLIPDIVRSIQEGSPLSIRYPDAIRPWQHVLEPLRGYLMLAERLHGDHAFEGAWNFGPHPTDAASVRTIVDQCRSLWGGDWEPWNSTAAPHFHEAGYLKLDSSKAQHMLGWSPALSLQETLKWVVSWYQSAPNLPPRTVTLQQLIDYQERVAE